MKENQSQIAMAGESEEKLFNDYLEKNSDCRCLISFWFCFRLKLLAKLSNTFKFDEVLILKLHIIS